MTLLCCVVADPHAPVSAGVLESLARSCSPRVEPHGDTAVVFDASGLTRGTGSPADIAREVTRLAVEQGLVVRVALAGTSTTAWVLAHARAGQTIVEPGQEAVALAQIPLGWVATLPESPANDPEAAAGPLVTGPRGVAARSTTAWRPLQGSSGTPEASAAAARSARPAPNPWSRDRLELLATLERWVCHARRFGRAPARRCPGAARTTRCAMASGGLRRRCRAARASRRGRPVRRASRARIRRRPGRSRCRSSRRRAGGHPGRPPRPAPGPPGAGRRCSRRCTGSRRASGRRRARPGPVARRA